MEGSPVYLPFWKTLPIIKVFKRYWRSTIKIPSRRLPASEKDYAWAGCNAGYLDVIVWLHLCELLGSLSNNDGDGYKTSHCFKLYRAYSISFTSLNVGKCFWSWILKECIKVQEKKRKLLSCFPVLDKTWIQALSRCSRATTAKKCTKKAWCTCKVVVLLIKPVAFLPFSLPFASSLLKLPISDGRTRVKFTILQIYWMA